MNNDKKINISETKLKPLMPVLREKKRFIRIKFESKFELDFDRFSKGFLYEITYLMGAIDVGKAGIWILKDKFNPEKKEVVIRCGVKFTKKFLAACLLINRIDSIDCTLNVQRVSGTLKGVRKE